MQTRAAILAATCLTVLATAASATPTGTVHISIAQGGQPAGQVLVGEANPVPVVTVQYSLTNMNGASAHIEVDLCSPANTESYYITNSLYTTALGTCQDGFGLGGKTVHSGSITVTGTSQGATGTFTFQAPAADIITPDGTPWTLPARIVVEDASNTVIATDTTTTITHAHTNPGAYKYFVSAADANDPQTNTQPGHNVTWYISATNYYWGGGGLAFQGTTTVTDPVPPGAVYVEGHQAGTAGTGFPNYPALNAAQLNSNFHITAPGAGVTSVQYSLDNLISTGAYEDGSAAYVTYWYPSSFTEADNTITAHFPSGPDQTASAVHYFPQGLGHLYMAKRHFCERGRSPNSSIFDDYNGWTTATAHKPNPHDNEQCAWAPEDTVRYQIIAYAFDDAYQNTSLAGTDFFDPIPAETTLVALPLLPSGVGWTMDYSTNASCSPLAPLDSSVPLNTVRCIHFATNNDSYTGVHSAEYDVRLNAPQVSSLNSRPGAYEFVDNTVTASGPWGTVNDAPGSSASYTLTSTFWNSRRPDGDLGTYWQEQLGVPFYILGEAPFALGYDYVDAFSGFDNLTFGATLPLEVDIVDGPTTHYSTTFLDDAGNTVTPTCSWGAQVRNGGTVTPAWYQCHVNGHVPSITPGRDPFSVCAPPFFCTDGYYGDQGPDGNPLWNEYRFYFQTKLVSGTQGQQIAIPMDIWADTGNVSPPDIAPTGGSASNPIHAVTYVTVTGEQQLRVSTSAAQTQVLVGGTATFNIGFQNTGSVTSQNTYVYDIFGYDPVTAQALGATYPSYGCTTQPTPFLGVSQVQGAPAVDIEYTTDASANVGSTWLPYTNTVDNSTVTGLRFRINSAYSSTAGQYSPSDLAGLVNVNFQAPDDLGSRICTMAAIQADGFLIAGALDSQTPIHIVSVIIDPPHSDIQANATYGTFCGASVALDGTASTSAVSYAWFDGSTPIGTDPSFSITLAPGTHDISLTTTNELGQTDTAHKTVTVTDGNAPTITCPDGPIYASIDAQCNPSTTITATAADDCDGSLTPTCTALQAGDGSVTCSVTDSAGNTATCSVETHVTGGNTAPSFAIDSFLTSPNGGICENSYFQVSGTYSPGCGSSAGVQVTASYFDAQGGEHQFYSWYGQPYLYDNGDGTFQVYDYFSTTDVDGNTPPSGATIKITLTNSDGSTIVNTYANTTVETCGCIEVFSPGLGAVMFEDLHPSNGDFDFNDQVVTYEYTAEEDGNTGKIMRMKAMFNDLAIGATIHSSLNLGIPGLSPDHISRIDRYFSDGTQDTLQPVVGEQSSAVIPVLDDTFQLYSSGSYINTDPNQAQQSGRGVAIVITFTDDTYYWDVFSNEAPLDLFIARTGNYGRQIHLPAYGPTDMGTEDLRNTADDASNTNGWGNYTNTDGVPFAISIPDFPQYWATERTDVASVFTELVPWVQSGGSDYNYYYWYGEAIDTSHAIPAPLPISSDSVGPVFQSFTNFCGD